MGLAIFAEISAIGVNDRGGIVIDADAIALVQGHDQHHIQLLRQFAEALGGGAVGDLFCKGKKLRILYLTEIGPHRTILDST